MMHKYNKIIIILLTCSMMMITACSSVTAPVMDSAPESSIDETTRETTPETAAEETTAVPDMTPTEKPLQVSDEELQKNLNMITADTRYIGTTREMTAVDNIEAVFNGYGYETTRQGFDYMKDEEGGNIKGTNLIAVKYPVSSIDTGDILIVSAHHDTVMGTVGADDNASGVTALLELARVLKDAKTDTEIRFISFSGEEVGRVGSKNYVEYLTDDEKSRIIGDIQLDMLGYYADYNIELGTVDGAPTMLGNLLQGHASNMLHEEWKYVHEEMSDHSSFVRRAIPGLVISQDVLGYENHTIQDRQSIINVSKIRPVVEVVARTVADIMSTDTAELIDESRKINPSENASYIQRKDNVIYFGMDYIYTENEIGLTGTLVSEETDEVGDIYSVYSYPMKWFGYDEIINTNYTYRNGYFEQVDILAAEAGLTFEDMKSMITLEYGEPTNTSQNDYGMQFDWDDNVHRKYFSLIPTEDSYMLQVFDSYMGIEVLRTYDLTEEITETADMDERDKILLGLVNDIMLPRDIKLIKQFQIYTDGIGGQLGFTSPFTEDDNTTMTYAIDIDDAFNSDGSFRNYTKTIKSMVHEYGHVLSENSSQVNIHQQGDLPYIFYDTESYTKTAYIRLFYEKFVKNIDDAYGTYYQSHPDYFVDKYATTNTSEDFAETFMVFILTDKPEDDGSGGVQKILFFYDFEEMITLRDYIRNNLGM